MISWKLVAFENQYLVRSTILFLQKTMLAYHYAFLFLCLIFCFDVSRLRNAWNLVFNKSNDNIRYLYPFHIGICKLCALSKKQCYKFRIINLCWTLQDSSFVAIIYVGNMSYCYFGNVCYYIIPKKSLMYLMLND